jgi:hypothetical protein
VRVTLLPNLSQRNKTKASTLHGTLWRTVGVR